MTASVGDYVLDNGLNALDTLADKIYICNAEPTTFALATGTASSPDQGYALGVKDFGSAGAAVGSPYFGSPDITGRAVDTVAVSGGTVSVAGTASYWAVVDSANSRLLAHGAITTPTAVTGGGTWTLNAIKIQLPNQ